MPEQRLVCVVQTKPDTRDGAAHHADGRMIGDVELIGQGYVRVTTRKPVVRVTRVLEDSGIKEPWGANDGSAMRLGEDVHLATELHDRGILDPRTVDAVVKPYLMQWSRWVRHHVRRIVAIEQRVRHEAYDYAGTLDRVIEFEDGRTGVLDIKTGQRYEWHPIQTAAYALAWTDALTSSDLARWSLYLDGTAREPRMDEHRDDRDYAVFISAVTIRNWLLNRGRIAS